MSRMVLKSRASMVPVNTRLEIVPSSVAVKAEANPPAVIFTVFGEPVWVMEIVCKGRLVDEMVTIAKREDKEELAVAVKVKVLLPVPDAEFIVSHV